MTKQGPDPTPKYAMKWAGSLPLFPRHVGRSLVQSLDLSSFQPKRVIFGSLEFPGDIHVFSAVCQARERLRVQMLAPVLPAGKGLAPAVALVAQSLPYSADVCRLPFALPAGYSAVVALPPSELLDPVRDPLTAARYYPGFVIDTRTLVSGRCYIVVWSPQQNRGKYALQVGTMGPWSWLYWLQLPRYWWQIRGWFGLSRAAAWIAGVILALAALIWALRMPLRQSKA